MKTLGVRVLLVGLLLLGGALIPAPASAQLVFNRGTDLYASADDGSDVHLLVAARGLGMDQGLSSPAVAPSGNELLFWGETYRNSAQYKSYTTYGANADGVYALSGGQVRRLSGAPAPARNADGNPSYSSGEEEPEPVPSGSYVYQDTQCSVYFDSEALTWDDACGTTLDSAPLSRGSAGAAQFVSDCDGSGSGVRDPSADPASASPIVAYGGCSYSSEPGNPLVDPQAELVISGPAHRGQVRVALGADTCCVPRPSAGFSDPSWSADGRRLVAYNSGGDHQTYNGYGFDTTPVPAGLYVYSDLSQTTSGTLALAAPADGQGGYLQLSSPRFMGTDKIVFAAQGSIWSIPAACNQCSFPAEATKLYEGGSNAATQASGVAWTTGTIQPASTPSASAHLTIRSARAAVSVRTTKVTLTCTGAPCRGSLSLVIKLTQHVRRRVHGHMRTLTVSRNILLARAPFTLAAGSARSVVLHLTRAAQRMLAHAHRRQMRVQATVTMSRRSTATRTLILWLQPHTSRSP